MMLLLPMFRFFLLLLVSVRSDASHLSYPGPSLKRGMMAQGTTGDDAWWVYYNASAPSVTAVSGSGGGSSVGKSSSGKTSSSPSKTSSYSSSSYSSYRGTYYTYSSYRYAPSSYRPMYYSSANLLLFIVLYDHTYLGMNFMDVEEKQYCPLNYCRFINETTVNTPLRRNVTIAEMVRQANHTRNATTLQHVWMNTYGCSVNFDECLTSNATHSLDMFVWMTCFTYVTMLLFLFFSS